MHMVTELDTSHSELSETIVDPYELPHNYNELIDSISSTRENDR